MTTTFGPPQVIDVRDLCKTYDGKVVIDHPPSPSNPVW